MPSTHDETRGSDRLNCFTARSGRTCLLVCLAIGATAVRVVADAPGPSAGDGTKDSPGASSGVAGKAEAKTPGAPAIPEPKQAGGEPESVVQVANLIYAGVKSSHCFSDHFLVAAEKESAISTSRRFHAVKLSSDELFGYPLVIMTGEGVFELTDSERSGLRQFVERGGLLLSSAGCSSREWDRSFRREMAAVFPGQALTSIGMDHPLFHTVHEINELKAKHGTPRPLEGVTIGGRLGVVYSQDGLNDTAHTQGCCCCGGNEITNCIQVNINILAYALLY